MKSKHFIESQYQDFFDYEPTQLGYLASYSFQTDPKRISFVSSRYKFVSKMFSSLTNVLELGCADGFYAPIVAEAVTNYYGTDFDPIFIDNANLNNKLLPSDTFFVHNMIESSTEKQYDGIFSLDVLEHIDKKDEDLFMINTVRSLKENGICIVGMPSLESQKYASEISKKGHVNCKSGPELKKFLHNFFNNVFIFCMNDEVVHTGYFPMASYVIALCCYPNKV